MNVLSSFHMSVAVDLSEIGMPEAIGFLYTAHLKIKF